MQMLMFNVLVWYNRYFKVFKHLLKQDSVDQNGVFMTRHLPSQERKQNPNLSGLQNRKNSSILFYAHLKIQLFVMLYILSNALINSVGLETFHFATLTVNSPLSTITCRRMSTTLWRFLILKIQISLVLLNISKKVVIEKKTFTGTCICTFLKGVQHKRIPCLSGYLNPRVTSPSLRV